MAQPVRKTVWRFLTKLNILSPYAIDVTLSSKYIPWYLPKGAEYLWPHQNQMFITALFIVVKTWTQSRCPL